MTLSLKTLKYRKKKKKYSTYLKCSHLLTNLQIYGKMEKSYNGGSFSANIWSKI